MVKIVQMTVDAQMIADVAIAAANNQEFLVP